MIKKYLSMIIICLLAIGANTNFITAQTKPKRVHQMPKKLRRMSSNAEPVAKQRLKSKC